jgi:hypothetical protein
MTAFRSPFFILWILAIAGCQNRAVIDTEARRNDAVIQPSAPSPKVFDIDHETGREVTIDGVLEGEWIYSPSRSGKTYGKTYKGTDPLRIRYQTVCLSLLAESEEVATLLTDHAGKYVRLHGRITQIHDGGRPGIPSGIQGYSGATPGHTVYCLEVASCELKDPDGIE